jgi:hypothetical protein
MRRNFNEDIFDKRFLSPMKCHHHINPLTFGGGLAKGNGVIFYYLLDNHPLTIQLPQPHGKSICYKFAAKITT